MLYLIILSLCIHFYLFFYARKHDKIFLGTLFFSHFYFCLGGYYFWIFKMETLFTGRVWGEEHIQKALLILSFFTTLLAFFVFFLSRNTHYIKYPEINLAVKLPKATWVFTLIGIVSSFIVIQQGILGGGFSRDRSAYFLIAYQLSDTILPVILFLVAVNGLTKWNILFILYFVIYASLVGFRYKIELLAIPLLALLMFSNINNNRKIMYLGILSSGVLALFSFLTLFRSKFKGIDLSKNVGDAGSDLSYGFFAETNIVFGMYSTISEYIDKDYYVYFDPIIDIFLEWVPRFIMPNRVTADYLMPQHLGFITKQGMNSATSYPFVGEFMMMFGWLGAFLGTFACYIVYRYLCKLLQNCVVSKNLWICGVGIFASVMAYYQYSRGYLPQISKSYICLVFPYLYLCYKYKQEILKKYDFVAVNISR